MEQDPLSRVPGLPSNSGAQGLNTESDAGLERHGGYCVAHVSHCSTLAQVTVQQERQILYVEMLTVSLYYDTS